MIYNKQLSVYAMKNLTYLTFLKRLNFNTFADINFKLKYRINPKNFRKIKLKIFTQIQNKIFKIFLKLLKKCLTITKNF